MVVATHVRRYPECAMLEYIYAIRLGLAFGLLGVVVLLVAA